MPLASPNNCWPANLQQFVDAVANSNEFQDLVGAADATAATASIFGKRLTHSHSGHAWTADELAQLRGYAMVYGDPTSPYGKHVTASTNYLPHGVTIVAVGRLVLEQDLIDHGDGRTGLTDTHDRDWQNIVGTILDEVLDYLRESGGPWPVGNAEVTEDSETKAENQPTRGCWQYCELSFSWREE